MILSDGTEKKFDYKYREKEEGTNQIIIATPAGGEKTLVKAIDGIADAIRNLQAQLSQPTGAGQPALGQE